MRPIECVMDLNSKANRGATQSFNPLSPVPGGLNPTLHALDLGSTTGFTKETIIPQKAPPEDNPELWRDAAYRSATLHALILSAEPANSWIGGNSKLTHTSRLRFVELKLTAAYSRATGLCRATLLVFTFARK